MTVKTVKTIIAALAWPVAPPSPEEGVGGGGGVGPDDVGGHTALLQHQDLPLDEKVRLHTKL